MWHHVRAKREGAGHAGSLWVRGGIPLVGAGGQAYETRNRMTLCRCGRSENNLSATERTPPTPSFRMAWARAARVAAINLSGRR